MRQYQLKDMAHTSNIWQYRVIAGKYYPDVCICLELGVADMIIPRARLFTPLTILTPHSTQSSPAKSTQSPSNNVYDLLRAPSVTGFSPKRHRNETETETTDSSIHANVKNDFTIERLTLIQQNVSICSNLIDKLSLSDEEKAAEQLKLYNLMTSIRQSNALLGGSSADD